VFSHRYGGASAFIGYWTIVSAGRHDVWAFGGPADEPGAPVAAHAHDGRWRVASLPKGAVGWVNEASAVSARDIWAVTSAGDVLYWNGAKWRIAKKFSGQLTGVTAFRAGNIWVFGETGLGPGAGTWHLRDGKWTKVTGLVADAARASATSSSDMWAVGDGVLAHYNGSTWQRSRYQLPKGFYLADVDLVAAGPGDIWALARAGTQHWLLHLQHGRWSRTRAPLALTMGGATSDGHGGLWAAGGNQGNFSAAYHLSNSGKWTVDTIGRGAEIHAITGIPGASAFLGAGTQAGRTGTSAAIWQIG
jgi:hypothetical protein